MITYEEITDSLTHNKVIKKTDNNGNEFYIPLELGNSDYQRYLRWLENPDAEEGGTL